MGKLTTEQYEQLKGVYKLNTVDDIQFAVKDLMKDVIQKTLEAELDCTLGYKKHDQKNKETENVRNGHYSKTVRSTHGPIELDIPRDRNGDHEPTLVKKGMSDISRIEDQTISMYAKGMSTRDIHAHMKDIYGINMSAEMVSKITDKLLPQIKEWQSRQLKSIYTIVYMDAIHFSVRDNGQTVKKAIYIAMAIDCEGMKDVLGIWVGENESSKYWLSVLTELKNRGVNDILICCVDGLSGFEDAINTAFPRTQIQRCVVHQIRYCCKFVNYKDRKLFCADMRAIYTAPTEEAALEAFSVFDNKWSKKYAYAIKSWENNWTNLSTFFKYPQEIRTLIYTTNPIESLNSCIRKTTNPKRLFPSDDAVRKSVFLAVQNRIKKWSMRTKDWGLIINQLLIHFDDRISLEGGDL
jgi:putative transposase